MLIAVGIHTNYELLLLQSSHVTQKLFTALIVLQNKALCMYIELTHAKKYGFPKCIIILGFYKSGHKCVVIRKNFKSYKLL